MDIDTWFTALAAIPREERWTWLNRATLGRLRIAADQVGAGDVDFMTKKQCIKYILEHF